MARRLGHTRDRPHVVTESTHAEFGSRVDDGPMLPEIDGCRSKVQAYAVTSAQSHFRRRASVLLQAISLSFGGKWTIIHVTWQVLRVNESGGLTMKVVAGSLGNDAIGPLGTSGGGMMVCPQEWGHPADRSAHIGCEILVALGRRRVIEGAVQIALVRGAFA
jgi:hypothetical protein